MLFSNEIIDFLGRSYFLNENVMSLKEIINSLWISHKLARNAHFFGEEHILNEKVICLKAKVKSSSEIFSQCVILYSIFCTCTFILYKK